MSLPGFPQVSMSNSLFSPDSLCPDLAPPKIPLVIIRYSYLEGRPKVSSDSLLYVALTPHPQNGSQFTSYLESKIAKAMPSASAADVRKNLQFRFGIGEKVPDADLSTFARLLSHNAGLLDPDYTEELQSHWNGVPRDVAHETRISFFVPCLRPRFR